MCRFLVYKGREIFMSDLLTHSEQSLILQSHRARERQEPLNGDGFGVGWYAPEIDLTPCVFTSITPAWSSRNLHRLADKVRSTCFFAHVRAASPGSFVSEANCHPFQYEQFLWMHNGEIGEFSRLRRRLRSHLSDDLYNFIQGNDGFGARVRGVLEPTRRAFGRLLHRQCCGTGHGAHDPSPASRTSPKRPRSLEPGRTIRTSRSRMGRVWSSPATPRRPDQETTHRCTSHSGRPSLQERDGQST